MFLIARNNGILSGNQNAGSSNGVVLGASNIGAREIAETIVNLAQIEPCSVRFRPGRGQLRCWQIFRCTGTDEFESDVDISALVSTLRNNAG